MYFFPRTKAATQNYRVGQKNETTLVRPTVATVQDKIKRIALKCSQSLREQRLGCNFYVVVKYSLQISFVL